MKDYTNKPQKVQAYERLLLVYKQLRADAVIDDV
jgi:hypothetical protein